MIIILQSLIIIGLLANSYSIRKALVNGVSGQADGPSQTIDQDVSICLSLSNEEKPNCAKMVGAKIVVLFSSEEDRIRECMKFRPLLVRYCQEGLNL